MTKRVKDLSLTRSEQLLFSDNRWLNTQQAKSALAKIKRRYLRIEERAVLTLKGMNPPKLDRHMADLFQVPLPTMNERKRKVYQLVLSYSWWLHNQDVCCYLVTKKLGPLHCQILLQIVERKTQLTVAKNLGVSQWVVWKRMQDNLRLLRHKQDFETFFRGLRLGYHLQKED